MSYLNYLYSLSLGQSQGGTYWLVENYFPDQPLLSDVIVNTLGEILFYCLNFTLGFLPLLLTFLRRGMGKEIQE